MNDDGSLDIADTICGLFFLFMGGPSPNSPYPGCGIKDQINGLDCKSYPGCEQRVAEEVTERVCPGEPQT